MHYMSIGDPEVSKAMQGHMMEMQRAMAQMQIGVPDVPDM